MVSALKWEFADFDDLSVTADALEFAASLFVAVLGASSYTFVEATRSQDLTLNGHAHVTFQIHPSGQLVTL